MIGTNIDVRESITFGLEDPIPKEKSKLEENRKIEIENRTPKEYQRFLTDVCK